MIKAILAMDKNKGIGKNNTVPFRFKSDMKHFREMTFNKNVIMGSKTYISLPANLKNRFTYVLTRDEYDFCINLRDLIIPKPDYIIDSTFCWDSNFLKHDSFIIGGSQIYKLFEPYIQEYYITEIDNVYNCDTFFINDLSDFDSEIIKEVEEDGVRLTFKRYWRK